eukprot:6443939-Pyramimonas_sp.AAC.1
MVGNDDDIDYIVLLRFDVRYKRRIFELNVQWDKSKSRDFRHFRLSLCCKDPSGVQKAQGPSWFVWGFKWVPLGSSRVVCRPCSAALAPSEGSLGGSVATPEAPL